MQFSPTSSPTLANFNVHLETEMTPMLPQSQTDDGDLDLFPPETVNGALHLAGTLRQREGIHTLQQTKRWNFAPGWPRETLAPCTRYLQTRQRYTSPHLLPGKETTTSHRALVSTDQRLWCRNLHFRERQTSSSATRRYTS